MTLQNHLTSSGLKMSTGKAEAARLVSKLILQMIRHFPLILYRSSGFKIAPVYSEEKLSNELHNLDIIIRFSISESYDLD